MASAKSHSDNCRSNNFKFLINLNNQSVNLLKDRISSFYNKGGLHFIQVRRNGCHIFDPSKNTKYPKLTVLRGNPKQIKVSQIVIFLQDRVIEEDPSKEISHLCHNTKCVNPEHLVLENHEINIQRKQCCLRRRCAGHVDLTNSNSNPIPDCFFAGNSV